MGGSSALNACAASTPVCDSAMPAAGSGKASRHTLQASPGLRKSRSGAAPSRLAIASTGSIVAVSVPARRPEPAQWSSPAAAGRRRAGPAESERVWAGGWTSRRKVRAFSIAHGRRYEMAMAAASEVGMPSRVPSWRSMYGTSRAFEEARTSTATSDHARWRSTALPSAVAYSPSHAGHARSDGTNQPQRGHAFETRLAPLLRPIATSPW
mmetsp:Transcript_32307/g.76943  ORF Transcript_32307/g.76943 Transcript_32307/m.76943 type:complete len:210 (+) Transcript_32307:250-879(+)